MLRNDLKLYGPESPPRQVTRRRARRYCRGLAGRRYENFTVLSRFFPRPLRQHLCNVYAYCRWADDLADETGDPRRSLAMLGWWERLLRESYQGNAAHPVFVALAETVERFEIPIDPFLDLLVAFRQDQRLVRYETTDQLIEYCRYSANPVGRLVLYLGRCHTPGRAQLSDAVCTGLQLANFWQDVARDFDRGRIYLPEADCRRYGYEPTDFIARTCNEPFKLLLGAEVDRAEGWLHRGGPLVNLMPSELRLPVAAFLHGGLEILEEIRRAEFDVWTTRPVVGKIKKLRILASLWWRLKRGTYYGSEP